MSNETQTQSPLKVILFGALITIISAVILLLPCVLIILTGKVSVSATLLLVSIAEFIAVIFGSQLVSRKALKHRFLLGVLSAAAFGVFLMIMGVFFAFPLADHTLSGLLIILLSGAIGSFIGSGKQKKK